MADPVEAGRERGYILAAQGGDSDAFGLLVRAYQRRAYAVARAIVVTHEDAEDAVQEGFLHAYRALDRFRPEQAFGAWLHRIVANAALDIGRRRRRLQTCRDRRDPRDSRGNGTLGSAPCTTLASP